MIDETEPAGLPAATFRCGRRAALRGALACAAATFMLGVAGCATDITPVLSPQDAADVARVEAYLNGLGALQAGFVQTWPDGGQSAGTALYLAPDRLRLTYAPPARMVMVAAGGELVLHDYASEAVTRVGLSHNPLGLLLRSPIRLTGEVSVTSVKRSPGALQISLARTDNPGQGLLTLVFATEPSLLLIGLEMVDAAGHHTTLHLYDQQRPATLDPASFDPATA